MNHFTIDQYQAAIVGTGRICKRTGRNLVAQCLGHSERNPSMEVFEDGWCQCYAGCGRFHISHLFPEFKDPDWRPEVKKHYSPPKAMNIAPLATEDRQPDREYTQYELYPEWEQMPLIPRTHTFKGLSLEILDELGWRWTDGLFGMAAGYFIPYFNAKKDSINFAQVRHLNGSRRFTFLPGAEMRIYGKWNLNRTEKVFVVEGPSDGAILEACMMPWVAMPSASSTALMVSLAKLCLQRDIQLIYAGDNDAAGDSLRQAIDEIIPYRVCQPPKQYKDWGDFWEATDELTVYERLNAEFSEEKISPMRAMAKDIFSTGGEGQGKLV